MATPTETLTRLWEADHPYYCSDTNYYVGALPRWASPRPIVPLDQKEDLRRHVPYDHIELSGREEFSTPAVTEGLEILGESCWATSDPDYNLLFRWDWSVSDPDDCEDGEELPPERLELFWMLQRKGRFMVVSFPVTRDQEPEIREWLRSRFEHLLRLWSPFAPEASS